MSRLNQKGIVHLLVPIILILGLVVGLYLVTSGNPLKLFSRASDLQIVFKDSSGRVLPLVNGVFQASSSAVMAEIISTLGPPASVSSPRSGTASYRTGFDLSMLSSSVFTPYLKEPTVYSVQFQQTKEVQFYWVEFKSVSGQIDRRSARFQLISASCKIRPACLDTKPVCRIPEPTGGWCPKSTPTPTPTATPAASLTISPTSLYSDGTLTVNWSGIVAPNLGDYINVTTADGRTGVTSHTYWIHNNCTWRTPSSGTPKSSGSCTITFSSQDQINTGVPGPYKLVLSSGNTPGISTVLATSNNFNLIKRVFITSATYNGNLVRPSFPLGGLSGADDKCNERAFSVNLGGNWKAWLSDSVTSAASRLNHNSGPYKLLNGSVVANNWADLIDGSLQTRINITETGTMRPNYSQDVWTGTDTTGNIKLPSKTCSNWTSSANPPVEGILGNSTFSDMNWTGGGVMSCNGMAALYCFEQ